MAHSGGGITGYSVLGSGLIAETFARVDGNLTLPKIFMNIKKRAGVDGAQTTDIGYDGYVQSVRTLAGTANRADAQTMADGYSQLIGAIVQWTDATLAVWNNVLVWDMRIEEMSAISQGVGEMNGCTWIVRATWELKPLSTCTYTLPT